MAPPIARPHRKTLAARATAPFSPADSYPAHEPPLAAREEAIYLMHIASEVEHALMVQYLYSPRQGASEPAVVAACRKHGSAKGTAHYESLT